MVNGSDKDSSVLHGFGKAEGVASALRAARPQLLNAFNLIIPFVPQGAALAETVGL
jgi:hypothetical protein